MIDAGTLVTPLKTLIYIDKAEDVPIDEPTSEPTTVSINESTSEPTIVPIIELTSEPTTVPIDEPTSEPTVQHAGLGLNFWIYPDYRKTRTFL